MRRSYMITRLMAIVPILALIVSVAPVTAQENGITFFNGSLNDAFSEAKKQNKLIFVSSYIEHCQPCDKMQSDIFTRSDLGSYFNQNFINIHLDVEKEDGKTFVAKYDLEAAPTHYFLDGEGNIVHKAFGAKDFESLMIVGKVALLRNDSKPGGTFGN